MESKSNSPYAGRDPAEFQFRFVIYEKRDYVAWITINRPEVLNCFNHQTLLELTEAFRDASFDDKVSVIVLTGAGREAFSTGADLKEQRQFVRRPQDYFKWMSAFIHLHWWIRNCGKPTIARLNGMVVGGGNELNIACDLAVAAEHVTLRQIGASNGSVAAGGATQWLPLIVGDRRAREILFLNQPIPASKALEWGWVNRVVPYEKLDQAVMELAEQLLQKLPECLRYTKTQLNFWRELAEALTVHHARDWLSIHNLSPEVREAITAFVMKRRPDYQGLWEMLREPTYPFAWTPEDFEEAMGEGEQ